jgi:hypothetical protein
VLFDEVVDRLKLLNFTRSLPWTERNLHTSSWDQTYKHLQELLTVREKLDKALSPHKKLVYASRQRLVVVLRQQIKGESPCGRELLRVVVGLFNANVRSEQYQLLMPGSLEKEWGLEIVEASIGESIHLNLQLRKGAG